MGRDTAKFSRDELRVVGGDYGTLVVEGTTEASRRTLDALVAATRHGGERVSVRSLVVEHDDTPDFFEDRHAGREGTPERGVGPDSTDDEAGAASRSRDRSAESSP